MRRSCPCPQNAPAREQSSNTASVVILPKIERISESTARWGMIQPVPTGQVRPMNLRQLTYFRAVVEHGSLVAASEVLHVAQPPLSVAIKQLEAKWSVRLFDRVGRGLVLTEMGRAAYDRACQLLGAASAVDQEMAAMGQGFAAHIRVGF